VPVDSESSKQKAQPARFTWTQLIALGLLLTFHFQELRHLGDAYGYSCLALCPVMVWCMPVVFCMLVWLQHFRTPASLDHVKAE